MAEMNLPAAKGNKPGVRRSKKLSTKVDLTPMVDLGFLLITFFIFTTSMSAPKATKLNMPKDSNDPSEVGQSNALTVLPYANNKVFYYNGDWANALKTGAYGTTTFSERDGLGQIIRNKQAQLNKIKPGNQKELVLMIKPTPESSYQNLVGVMDEILINDVTRYAIMDITDEEKKAVAAHQ